MVCHPTNMLFIIDFKIQLHVYITRLKALEYTSVSSESVVVDGSFGNIDCPIFAIRDIIEALPLGILCKWAVSPDVCISATCTSIKISFSLGNPGPRLIYKTIMFKIHVYLQYTVAY